VWGEVLDGLHLSRAAGLAHASAAVEQDAWEVQKALLDFLERHWHDPDDSLWEVRGQRRHFVHSKVLAWAGVDRAVRAVEQFGLDGPLERWKHLRETIHADVCANGYDAERNTFTQFYGSTGLDAALLLIPQVGFLPWDDPRVVGTVRAVAEELDEGGYIVRYRTDADGGVDGLGGKDAPFLACSFWMVTALASTGERRKAVELFERLLALCNDVGLLSEEYDPSSGRLTGNTPQAFSHVGLVIAAVSLSGGHRAHREPTPTAAQAALNPVGSLAG
jgi:GH15 family glucan-1,4-alpha-glucosidase